MNLVRWLFYLSVAACSEQAAESTRIDELVRHSTLYSAFDAEHEYRVVLSVSPEIIASKNPDSRVDWTSVRWTTDSAFVRQTDYPELAGAALLTTKRAGKTRVAVALETTEGARLQGEATLVISAASSEEWTAGDAYFNRSLPIVEPPPEHSRVCELSEQIELPYSRNCSTCHNADFNGIGGPCTPLDTAEYPDDALIATFAHGAKPRSGLDPERFIGAAERSGYDSACIFTHLHSARDIDERTARGLLWKLRSLDPVVPDGFDPELVNRFEPDAGFW